MTTRLDTFTRQYIETALWSSHDESDESGGEPMDAHYGVEDIHPDTLAEMVEDCRAFQTSFRDWIDHDISRAGHDFWLTRNGHGAGFWDGDWDDRYEQCEDCDPPTESRATVGDYLTAMSRRYGEFNLYIGDDGMIHGQ
jgi:hypothetical protein